MAAQPHRGPSPLLKVLTHNVGGLNSAAKVNQVLAAWRNLGAHLVLVQETWVNHRGQGCSEAQLSLWLQQAAEHLQIPQLQVWFCNNTQADGHRAGVAVVQLSSPPSGQLQVLVTHRSPDGRCMRVRLRWAGHKLHLLNTYWPNDRQQQQQFITSTLLPAATHLRQHSLVTMGDFNFVPNAELDRTLLPDGTAWNADRASETRMERSLNDQLQQANQPSVDAFRSKHPTARGFSYLTGRSGARLDRVYVPGSLLPFVHACRVIHRSAGDHLPVLLSLLPKAARLAARGPGLWRAKVAFLQAPALQHKLLQWVQPMVQVGMHTAEEDLLQWWSEMKGNMQRVVKGLQQEHARSNHNPAAVHDAATALDIAMQQLLAAPAADPAQIQAAAVARSNYQAATRAPAVAAAQQQRTSWLHHRECPGPTITRLLKPHSSQGSPTTLTDPGGQLVTDPAAVANLLVTHFAGISAQPQTDMAAQRAVLEAMTAQQQQGQARAMPAQAAAEAGSGAITEEEVRRALRKMARNKAPGPDGLPSELWQVGEGVWAPLLARLYSVMSAQHQLPADFALGRVAPIYKAGDAAQASNYRPITVLNADYKILAKVLTQRFGRALANSIGTEQSAFLPGRHIGDGIALAQLLPAALSLNQQPGAVVLLDIAKAYDTVDRAFLYQVMRAHGASDGMVRWVQLLLQDTRAVACIHGHVSRAASWQAGVRQGCPLSPLLYLYVGEALACWLRSHPQLGVVVDGQRYVSNHFADDTKVFLASLEAPLLQELLQHLQVFAAASNQHANAGKSSAVPVGTLPAAAPGDEAPIPVRTSARSLGVQVHKVPTQPLQLPARALRGAVREPPPQPAQPPSEQWEARTRAVAAMSGMVAGLPISAMGRGMGVSAYALSTALYHAEHEGLPEQTADALHRTLSRAVDRPRRLPGVHSRLLSGSPSAGGSGLLPVREHVTGRHIAQATALLHLLLPPPPQQQQPQQQEQQQQPQQQQAPPEPQWLPLARHVLQQVCPTLHPAQTLLLAAYASAAQIQQGRLSGVSRQRLLIPDGPLRRMGIALQRLGPLSFHPLHPARPQAQPQQWLQAQLDPATLAAAIPALVWGNQLQQPLSEALGPGRLVSVKAATSLQLHQQGIQQERERLHREYAQQAFQTAALPPDSIQLRTASFCKSFQQVWKLPVENRHKEVLWRLAVNGVAGAGGHDICLRPPCACGYQLTDAQVHRQDSKLQRQHVFWDCPVAQSVREQLQLGLGGAAPAVQQWQVWLLQPPPRVRPAVWRLVALAALEAMEYGRRFARCCPSALPPGTPLPSGGLAGQGLLPVSPLCRPVSSLGRGLDSRVALSPGCAARAVTDLLLWASTLR